MRQKTDWFSETFRMPSYLKIIPDKEPIQTFESIIHNNPYEFLRRISSSFKKIILLLWFASMLTAEKSIDLRRFINFATTYSLSVMSTVNKTDKYSNRKRVHPKLSNFERK